MLQEHFPSKRITRGTPNTAVKRLIRLKQGQINQQPKRLNLRQTAVSTCSNGLGLSVGILAPNLPHARQTLLPTVPPPRLIYSENVSDV